MDDHIELRDEENEESFNGPEVIVFETDLFPHIYFPFKFLYWSNKIHIFSILFQHKLGHSFSKNNLVCGFSFISLELKLKFEHLCF